MNLEINDNTLNIEQIQKLLKDIGFCNNLNSYECYIKNHIFKAYKSCHNGMDDNYSYTITLVTNSVNTILIRKEKEKNYARSYTDNNSEITWKRDTRKKLVMFTYDNDIVTKTQIKYNLKESATSLSDETKIIDKKHSLNTKKMKKDELNITIEELINQIPNTDDAYFEDVGIASTSKILIKKKIKKQSINKI